jgi:Cu2+-exporting ATPase
MKKLLPVLIALAAGATIYVWRTRANPTYVAPTLEEQATTPTTLTSTPGPGECVRVLDVSGMCCGGCPKKVRSALAAVPGVREAVVDFNAKTASVIAPAGLDVAKLEAAATFDEYAAKAKP